MDTDGDAVIAISAACLPPSARRIFDARRAKSRWVYGKRYGFGWRLVMNAHKPGSAEFKARQEHLLELGYALVVGTGEPIGRNGNE